MFQLLLLTLFSVTTQVNGTSQKYDLSGTSRDYILHLPTKFDSAKATPLMLAFHGLDESASTMEQDSGLSNLADDKGFVVVYPNGSGSPNSWNAGSCCGSSSDDVDFVDKVIAKVVADFPLVGKNKKYAVGMSNGAMMVNRLACEKPKEFAAVAIVAGVGVFNMCNPAQPVPLIHIHGDKDKLVPFNGDPQKFQSVDDDIKFWVKNNKSKTPAKHTSLSSSPMSVTQDTYDVDGAGTADVVLITVHGGGHLWPGQPFPSRITDPAKIELLGTTTQAVSANDLIWKFLSAH